MASRRSRAAPGPRASDPDAAAPAPRTRLRSPTEPLDAEHLRAALIAAALAAWESAGIQGLCADGRFEVAVGAMRSLDLRRIEAESAVPP